MQMFFSKVHPACHSIVNRIEPGSNSKRLISMLPIAQKQFVWALSDLCEMFKLFIQQCDQNYLSSCQKSNSCLYRKNFMQVRAFERYIPLMKDCP